MNQIIVLIQVQGGGWGCRVVDRIWIRMTERKKTSKEVKIMALNCGHENMQIWNIGMNGGVDVFTLK